MTGNVRTLSLTLSPDPGLLIDERLFPGVFLETGRANSTSLVVFESLLETTLGNVLLHEKFQIQIMNFLSSKGETAVTQTLDVCILAEVDIQ